MPDWIVALTGLLGAVIGALIAEISHWADRRQRFRAMILEKRLEIYQEMAAYCFKIANFIGALDKEKKESIENLFNGNKDLQNYANEHFLYIDDRSLAAIATANKAVDETIEEFIGQGKLSDKSKQRVKKTLSDVLRLLTESVGYTRAKQKLTLQARD